MHFAASLKDKKRKRNCGRAVVGLVGGWVGFERELQRGWTTARGNTAADVLSERETGYFTKIGREKELCVREWDKLVGGQAEFALRTQNRGLVGTLSNGYATQAYSGNTDS